MSKAHWHYFDALDPAVIFTAPEPAQVLTAVPATAEGAVVIVSVLVSEPVPHEPLPDAVSVNVTLPAVLSAALGI